MLTTYKPTTHFELLRNTSSKIVDISQTRNSSSPGKFVASWQDSRAGESLPAYQKIIDNGGDATTSFDAVRFGLSYLDTAISLGWQDLFQGGPSYQVNTIDVYGAGWLEPTKPSITSNITSADNLALQSLYKNILSLTTSVDGMMILGEFGETLAMLKSPLTALRSSMLSYTNTFRLTKNGILKRGMTLQEVNLAVAGTYLEYVFGWANLIRDINDICKTLNKQAKNVKTFKVTGQGTSEKSQHVASTMTAWNSYAFVNIDIVDTDQTSVLYSVGLRPDDVALEQSVNKLYGFTPERFVPTLWEIMPWSWAIDYFANVGSIIEALCSRGVKQTYVCRNTRSTQTRFHNASLDQVRFHNTFPAADKKAFLIGEAGNVAFWNINVTRRKLSSIPVPSLEFKVPTYWKNWLNLSAVTAQRVNISKVFNALLRK